MERGLDGHGTPRSRVPVFWVALAAVLLLGAYLRLDGLAEPSLWHDEIYHKLISESVLKEPPSHWLSGFEADRENGPLYYGTQLVGDRLVGGDLGVRLVPALLGIATLPLIAVAGMLISGRALSLIATLLLALSPLHVCLSRDGRPYAALMLASCLVLIALLRSNGRGSVALAYGVCIAAAYTGAISLPLFAAFGTIAAFGWAAAVRRQRRRPASSTEQRSRRVHLHFVLAACAGMALIAQLYFDFGDSAKYAPTFDRLRSKMVTPPTSARAVEKFVASMSTSGLTWVSIEGRSIAFWIAAGFGTLLGLAKRRRATLLTSGLFALVSVTAFVALIATGRFYGMRYTCAALPPFILLVGMGVESVAGVAFTSLRGRWIGDRPRRVLVGLIGLVMALLLAGPNFEAARDQPFDRLDWRGLARRLHDMALEGETVVCADRWPHMCLSYYLRDLPRSLSAVDASGSVATARRLVESSASAWLVTAGIRPAPRMRKWMHRYDHVASQQIAELDVFFAPDFRSLIDSRFKAGRGDPLIDEFERQGRRYEFEADELLLQGKGWSFSERNREDVSFQWADAGEAELALPLAATEDRLIRFRVLPFSYPEAAAQTVELVLNGASLGAAELSPGWNDLEMRAAAEAWLGGRDILVLKFGRTESPAQVIPGSSDWRRLSAAFDYLEVVSAPRP